MDETCHDGSRFRAIAVVSVPVYLDQIIEDELLEILNKSDIHSEFKWEKLRTAKYNMAAHKMLEYVVNRCVAGQMRIDIMGWDMLDLDSDAFQVDKYNLLDHMECVILRRVVGDRWENPSIWRLYPDEGSNVDWYNVKHRINNRGKFYDFHGNIVRENNAYSIDKVEELRSSGCAMIQVADMFAGMMAYSIMRDVGMVNLTSNSVKYRDDIVDMMKTHSRLRFLGIYRHVQGGMKTRSRNSNINFWRYKPGKNYNIVEMKKSA